VEESRDSTTFGSQRLVPLQRAGRLVAHRLHSVPLEQCHGFGTDAQPALPAAAQHDEIKFMLDQFVDVCRLDARAMLGAGLPPVPGPAATWPHLRIPEPTEPLDLDVAPAVGDNPRRRLSHSATLDRSETAEHLRPLRATHPDTAVGPL
jgi:hypothetical protein